MTRKLGVVEWGVFLLIAAVSGWLVASWSGWKIATDAKNWWDIATAVGTVAAVFIAALSPYVAHLTARAAVRRSEVQRDLICIRTLCNEIPGILEWLENYVRGNRPSKDALTLKKQTVDAAMQGAATLVVREQAQSVAYSLGRMGDYMFDIHARNSFAARMDNDSLKGIERTARAMEEALRSESVRLGVY